VAGVQLGLGPTLPQEARVIQPLVLVREELEDALGFLELVRFRPGELLGEREAEQAERLLVLDIDVENVAADGLRFRRLVGDTGRPGPSRWRPGSPPSLSSSTRGPCASP
jgi:hypothetical protein